MPFETESRYLGQFEPKLSRLGADKDLWWVVPFAVRYVVGVAGRRFAGSSTTLTFLGEKLGFQVYSLSHELRRIAQARGVSLDSRSDLQDLGDELRAENDDGGHLARLTLQRIRADFLRRPESRARIAVGGFKHPDEVKVFEDLDHFHFLCLNVGVKRRYERARESGMLAVELAEAGVIGKGTRRQFVEHVDRRDRDGRCLHSWTGKYGQYVDGVLDRGSGSTVIRNGRIDRGELFQKLSRWAQELDGRHQKPEP